MSDARIAAVVVAEKEPVFTLLMRTLFRSSRLHLQGQRMSHWYGKTCCGENIVMTITVHNGTRDKNNSLLPHRCSWASWELPRWADLWLERELLFDVFKHRWGYICETLGGGGVGWGWRDRKRKQSSGYTSSKTRLSKNKPQLMMSNETLSKPYHAMWWTMSEASSKSNKTEPDGTH